MSYDAKLQVVQDLAEALVNLSIAFRDLTEEQGFKGFDYADEDDYVCDECCANFREDMNQEVKKREQETQNKTSKPTQDKAGQDLINFLRSM